MALKCLSYDFVGTSLDESSEDLGTIQVPIKLYEGRNLLEVLPVIEIEVTTFLMQIPSSWRPIFEDTSTLQLFFDYYVTTKPPLSKEVFVL